MCEKLGAELEVRSEVGVGSTFRVTLPPDASPVASFDQIGAGRASATFA